MRYNVEDIEDQIIATLTGFLSNTQIRTHAGEITATFLDPSLMEGVVNLLPFVFVQYHGKRATSRDSMGVIYIHQLTFRLYVGARSLRSKKEAQRSAYGMLRTIYDALHGRVPNIQGLAGQFVPNTPQGALNTGPGGSITTAGFNAQTPIFEAGGQDELLVYNLPTIAIYQTDYTITLIA